MGKFFNGSAASDGPQLLRDILDGMFQSDSPFAQACREHNQQAFPNTEPCVDLKLITRSPGRMDIGQYRSGMLTRDAEDHYLFVENDMLKRQTTAQQRNPHVYEGRYINVNRSPEGKLYPTFNRPPYTTTFSFSHFCLAAAEELQQVAGRTEHDRVG